ncbi:16S rRNA (cytidine1402-2'-O)-methyltransferase [Paenibacillus cellulosilyticus]|uniref:Ribosomal RNA small subunit methyltransferase I n=1 Tax=Paenibacillus cellulosilyticus TaxID=375489 RepID=A0A2V2YQK0_9BACL|nr:16S rRNA (cytidine(1402)-2'-O)-methyltransferase [Paenibacillus cellulosilyticus]PWV95935.1 16S rRNA (cytidine1402-2'-O)-methyltransferase [Paenibacillus cellulosilyticus]QKS48409.1 16S rRNA (cytidine(1402)-2'-O)-methyltransferase [Paenibacillus cellulosilyticus]
MIQVQRSFAGESGGTLYLVATPIGNLEDMTFRAIRTLSEVDLIAAEDTRQTRKLLTHFEIQTRLVSYHEHNKRASGPELIRLLEEGTSIALVSDAGLPAISDPGADLVRDAAERGIPVVPIPGANAALSALIISGLPTERFLFAGFPPRQKKALNEWLTSVAHEPGTLMMYESPHRIEKTLAAMLEVLGDRRIVMARELTKRHEEAARGTISECMIWLEEHPPLGEYVIIVEGRTAQSGSSGSLAGTGIAEMADGVPNGAGELWWSALTLDAHVRHYEEQAKLDRKEAIKRTAADRSMQKRDVYNAVMRKDERE